MTTCLSIDPNVAQSIITRQREAQRRILNLTREQLRMLDRNDQVIASGQQLVTSMQKRIKKIQEAGQPVICCIGDLPHDQI